MAYLLAASLLGCATLAYVHFRPVPELKFHRLTFRRGKIHAARFAPDGHTIVYSAQWEDQPFQLFVMRDDSPESRPLGLSSAGLFAISSTSQLAVGLNLRSVTTFVEEGTLAQAPFSGGAPRSLLNDVRFADWTPDGSQLAVVRETPKAWQIEFPPGQVLYQGPSSGYISELRFSPDGGRLAFLEHPTVNSDGYVAVVDRSGQKKILTPDYEGDATGLAWSAKGDEVWFTAAKTGSRRELWAVTLSGRQRRVARYPVSLLLQDIARDGRVLLSSTLEDRSKILFRGSTDARERELSWLDYSVLRCISADGKQITFDESGDGSPEVSSYIRDTDGSGAVKLGPGQKPDLSPDRQWALTVNINSDGLIIYPVGAGDTKRIALKGFNIERAFWHPNGREVLMSASNPGHGSRIFRVSLQGGAPRPITPEGVRLQITGASPDGQYVPGVMTSSGKLVLWPIDGGQPLEVKGALDRDSLAGWSGDGKSLFTFMRGAFPLRLDRLDFRTGRRDLVREITPLDRAGVSAAGVVKVTPDGKAYAYSQTQALHELELVVGLK
jgi:Tol biopolymer transport system component